MLDQLVSYSSWFLSILVSTIINILLSMPFCASLKHHIPGATFFPCSVCTTGSSSNLSINCCHFLFFCFCPTGICAPAQFNQNSLNKSRISDQKHLNFLVCLNFLIKYWENDIRRRIEFFHNSRLII